MKIALIGDVHANLPALETVLAHAHNQGVKAIWNIGDFVGYGAFPEEVVQRLRAENAVSIQGNYDRKVIKVEQKREKWAITKAPEKWLAFVWAYDHLSEESREYLRTLPEQKRLDVEEHTVLLVHGSPASQDEHLALDTPQERLEELARITRADIIVCGHSHQPFTRQVHTDQSGIVYFVNTGSVGRPNDGDPRAAYAVADIRPGVCQFTHYRIAYDVQRAASAIRENGLPDEFARMIEAGRDLDAVKDDPSGP